jgi:sec-independent protein translocase protein TatB
MFGIDSAELLIIAIVALVVIGPKDLPNVMRTVGSWIGRARGMARHFRSGIDTMMREAELDEMQQKWAADNERIMREHPMAPTGDPPPLTPPAPSSPVPPNLADPVAPPPADRPRPAAPPRRAAPKPPPRSAPKPPPRELP